MGKVKFGISKVHLAKMTRTVSSGTESISYATPVPFPGAVSLSMDAEGDQNIFYADNSQFAVFNTNNGFSGELEMADIPDTIRTTFMGYATDADGNCVEVADPVTVEFALMCEISSNDKPVGVTFFDCTFGRPGLEANTTTDSTDPDTSTIPINVSPIEAAGKTVVKSHIELSSSTEASYFSTAPELPTWPTSGGGSSEG